MSGTSTDAAAQEPAAQAPQESRPAGAATSPEPPGFRSRGSARRRARFLRKARELGYRDLGGLVFNLHRFAQRNDALVLAKLTTLGHIDTELRGLEGALGERRPVTVLREAGITACARCAAIHSSEDNFCPNCGLPMKRHVEVIADLRSGVPAPATAPIATAATTAAPAAQDTQEPRAGGSGGTPAPPVPPSATTAQEAPGSVPPDSTATAGRAASGRSPSPPGAAPTTSQPPGSPAPAPTVEEEDGPTEIISPPVSGS
jgi:hypothetical protein